MSADEIYINPDIGYYGQSVKSGDNCYINTGRTGEMTGYYEHTPPTVSYTHLRAHET